MVCSKCGRENNEKAVFCAGCGNRLEEKAICPECGEANEKGSAFCVACGARLDGKCTCPKCGEVNEKDSAFCVVCGTAITKAVTDDKKGKTAAENKANLSSGLIEWNGEKVGKICRAISGVALMLGVLFSMLFVWFIQVKITANNTSAGQEFNIYYFFGKAWKALGEMTATTIKDWTGVATPVSDGIFSLIKTETVIYNSLGAILCAAILIGVTVFGIKACIDYLSALVSRNENKSEKSAVRCLLCFLGGAILFSCFANIMTLKDGAETAARVTGMTTAGIVLACIALGVKFICKLIAKAPEIGRKENSLNLICSIIGLIFSVVLICLVGSSVITPSLKEVDSSTSKTTLTNINAGFFTFANWIVRGYGLTNKTGAGANYTATVKAIEALNIYSVIGQLALFGFIALAVWLLCINMRKVEGEQKAMLKLVLSGILTLLAVMVLVCAILSCNAAQSLCNADMGLKGSSVTRTIEGGYGIPIACIIFSVLSFVVEIVRVYLEKMKAQENE